MTKAFTLVELLVVVLIIGILASIAVPQYKITVLRGKMSTAIPMIQSLYNAQQMYYAQHAKFATSLLDLSIVAGDDCTVTRCYFGNNEIILDPTFAGAIGAYIYSKYETMSQNLTVSIVYNTAATLPAANNVKSGTILCVDRNVPLFAKACQSYGGKDPFPFTGGSGGGQVWKISL